MKKLIKISQFVTLLVSFFFVVMAIDSLFGNHILFDKILAFLISVLPAISIILIYVFFRNYYKLSGLLYIGLSIVYFFFFRPYSDFSQGWPVLIIVIIPLLGVGLIHLFFYKKIKK
ncbi:hypothetical protein KHQ88_01735 [Mycoplasmatota bacterium]|nr:hypothetical protein KHQ88_01735 [Mycoplasmatota bacterium]